jgi:hypothetical protein
VSGEKCFELAWQGTCIGYRTFGNTKLQQWQNVVTQDNLLTSTLGKIDDHIRALSSRGSLHGVLAHQIIYP